MVDMKSSELQNEELGEKRSPEHSAYAIFDIFYWNFSAEA